MKIISWTSHDWTVEYIIRKSIWLLVLYILKFVILLFILLGIAFLSFKLKSYVENEDAIYLIYILWILVRLLMLYIFIRAMIVFIKFFYWVEIINETKIYKLNIWIFHIENISITNISNIQEVKAVTTGFLRVIFWISDVHIIEQRDKEEILHFIDEWKKVADIISWFKDKLVRKEE